jgi:hypothetical protein
MSNPTFWSRVSTNENKRCTVDGCFNSRHKVSGLCKHHSGVRDRYGHPLGRAILKREYQAEQGDIKEFVARNVEHAAIKAGVQWFDGLLKAVSQGLNVPAKRELKQLIYAGVDGRKCLEAVLSTWLYSNRRPSLLPDDIRLTFAIARAVLGLAPREKKKVHKNGKEHFYYRKLSYSSQKALGAYIRESLAVLAVNVFQALHRKLQREDELRTAMMKEFA